MPGRASALPLLLVLPLAAGCEPTGSPPSPAPTVTVTVTPAPTPPGAEPSAGASPGGDALAAVQTVHEAWSSLDVQCKNETAGDLADAACDARDEVGAALGRTAIAAYVRAWRARDAETIAALTPPDQQEAVDFVLGFTLPEDAEPMCIELGGDDDAFPAREECTVVPVESEGSEEAPGWLMRLDPTWGDERLAPQIYVVAEQIDYG